MGSAMLSVDRVSRDGWRAATVTERAAVMEYRVDDDETTKPPDDLGDEDREDREDHDHERDRLDGAASGDIDYTRRVDHEGRYTRLKVSVRAAIVFAAVGILAFGHTIVQIVNRILDIWFDVGKRH